MTDQTQDETTSRVAALGDEFPGYEFSYTDDGESQPGSDPSAGRYRIVAQESGSWSAGGGTSGTGHTVDAAVEAIRSALRSNKG